MNLGLIVIATSVHGFLTVSIHEVTVMECVHLS